VKKGWNLIALGDVCDIYQPQTISMREMTQTGPYKVFGANGVIGNYDKYNHENSEILVTCRGATCGSVNISEPKMWITGNSMVIHSKTENLHRKFLYYVLKNIKFSQIISGTAQPQITRTTLSPLKIPLPSLAEQIHIAEIIDKQMSAVEKAKVATKAQLEAAKALPAAYLREVFNSPEAQKWPKKKLEDISRVFAGGSAPQGKEHFDPGGPPFVRVSDVGATKRTTFLIDIYDHLSEKALKEHALVFAKKGTVIFPKSGAAVTTNNRAILGVDAYIVSHLMAIEPKENIVSSLWLYWVLCQIDMVGYSDNPAYPSLKQSTVGKIQILLPPLHEQNRILSILKDQMVFTEKVKIALEGKLDVIDKFSNALLRKAFNGEL